VAAPKFTCAASTPGIAPTTRSTLAAQSAQSIPAMRKRSVATGGEGTV
jgi:hypothetical protein